MMRSLTRLGAAAAAALLSLTLSAAALPLGLEQRDAPVVTGTGGAFLFPPVDVGLSFFGTALPSGGTIALNTEADFSDGEFTIVSPALDPLLAGNLADFGFIFDAGGEDRLELLFDVIGGSAAPEFGNQVLAFITGEFGTDASALATGFGFGSPVAASIRIATPIPLPAAPVLLLSGLALFGLFRRRRHAAA